MSPTGRAARRLGHWSRFAWLSLSNRGVSSDGLLRVGPRFRCRVYGTGRVTFGAGCEVDRDATIECSGELTVGAGTSFGHTLTLAVHDRVTIGSRCLVGELVSIRDHDHAIADPTAPIARQGARDAPVVIGDNVWLGGKVTVLRGVTIGANTVVGANAVVDRDLPANCVAAGVPARVVKMRDGSEPPAAQSESNSSR